MTTNIPETPDQVRQRQTITRKTKELEAELGGRALGINADQCAIYLAWHLDGMLDLGGTAPREQVPSLLRELADRLEALVKR